MIEKLEYIWAVSNMICGKRLKAILPTILSSLKTHKEISITENEEALLLKMSASTMDRLLTNAKKDPLVKGKSSTKPGTLLKHQIPIRTFADWNEKMPGFIEIDLVAHCGVSLRGEYVNTLSMTDIETGWTLCSAFMGRSERFCVQAIEEVKALWPFTILGIDSDNGSEFINAHFKRYCERNSITFTRARPYKKNDNAHIEQKNWDVVRKILGYSRYDNQEQLIIINDIFRLLAFYQNYFQPSVKLISKQRKSTKHQKHQR